jgi:hypothetical protein
MGINGAAVAPRNKGFKMTYHIRFAISLEGEAPFCERYHIAENIFDLREVCMTFVKDFQNDHPGCLVSFLPTSATNALLQANDASALNWRLCIAKDSDHVLDVIGMTESEWESVFDD